MGNYEQNLHKYSGFLGSGRTIRPRRRYAWGCRWIIRLVSNPGTRFGPLGIRNASYGLEEYSIELDRALSDCRYYDGGNVWLPLGNVSPQPRAHRRGCG